MRCIMKNCSTLFALVAVLACFSLIAGCANSGRLSQLTAVPEIHPGVPAGYLPHNTLPNSLVLLPPFSRLDPCARALPLVFKEANFFT